MMNWDKKAIARSEQLTHGLRSGELDHRLIAYRSSLGPRRNDPDWDLYHLLCRFQRLYPTRRFKSHHGTTVFESGAGRSGQHRPVGDIGGLFGDIQDPGLRPLIGNSLDRMTKEFSGLEVPGRVPLSIWCTELFSLGFDVSLARGSECGKKRLRIRAAPRFRCNRNERFLLMSSQG